MFVFSRSSREVIDSITADLVTWPSVNINLITGNQGKKDLLSLDHSHSIANLRAL